MRLGVGLARQVHNAAHALNDKIIARAMRIRPIVAKARDGAIDEAGVEGAQAGIIQAIFDQPPGFEILNQHIGPADQLAHDLLALWLFKIDRHRAFAAIAGMEIGGVAFQEGRTPATRVIARPWPLDLDDIGTQIGKRLPCPWPREDAGEFDDFQSL